MLVLVTGLGPDPIGDLSRETPEVTNVARDVIGSYSFSGELFSGPVEMMYD